MKSSRAVQFAISNQFQMERVKFSIQHRLCIEKGTLKVLVLKLNLDIEDFLQLIVILRNVLYVC